MSKAFLLLAQRASVPDPHPRLFLSKLAVFPRNSGVAPTSLGSPAVPLVALFLLCLGSPVIFLMTYQHTKMRSSLLVRCLLGYLELPSP